MAAPAAAAADPAGVQVQRLFTNFLEEYRADNADGQSQEEPVYVHWLRELKSSERTTLYVEFSHLLECAPAGSAAPAAAAAALRLRLRLLRLRAARPAPDSPGLCCAKPRRRAQVRR
jgi:hypothetical protein